MKNSVEIQHRVIGLCLRYPQEYLNVAESLKPSMFDESLRGLVTELFEWCLVKDSIDLVILAEEVGVDASFLRGLFLDPALETLPVYVDKLRTHYLSQFAKSKFAEADQMLLTGESVSKVLDHVHLQISEEVDSVTHLGNDMISSAVIEAMDLFQRSIQAKDLTGVDTGYADLNALMGGWQPSDQIVIAARPGMGKTTMAGNLILNVAAKGVPVAFFSLEMSKTQCVNLLASIMTDISTENIRSGRLSEAQQDELTKAYEKIARLPIFLFDDRYTIHEIVTKIAQLRRKFGIKICVLDYIQLAEAGNKYKDRHHQVELISRRLKQVAKREGITNIILAQLNRQCDARPNKRPLLSDLKESGAIEQDADMVLMIYREGYYHPDADQEDCDLIIRKHRHGRTAVLKRIFRNRKFIETTGYDLKKRQLSMNGRSSQPNMASPPF